MKTVAWFGLVLGALSAAGTVIITKPGQAVNMECGATFKSSLEWCRETERIFRVFGRAPPAKGKSPIQSRSRLSDTTLKISNVQEADGGSFTCETGGKIQRHTLLVVSVSASPSANLHEGSEATLQCRVGGLSPESQVRWKRPNGQVHAETGQAQLKPVAQSDAGNWKCEFSYDGQMHEETLVIKVGAPAPKTPAPGPSQNSEGDCAACTVQPSISVPPSKPSVLLLGLHWWVFAAIGAGCVVVVLLIIFIIVLCKRIKKRKRELYKMKNSGRLLTPRQYCRCDRTADAPKPRQGRRREKPSALPLPPV